MAFSVCSAPPGQIGSIRVAKGSVEGSASQKERKGEQVEDNSQSSSGARPGGVGDRAHGKTVESIEALGGLLE